MVYRGVVMVEIGLRPGPEGADAVAGHRSRPGAAAQCPVTIICGDRRLDVALPSTVPCSDLLPGLLRLLAGDRPPDGTEGCAAEPDDRPGQQPVVTALPLDPPVPDPLPLARWVMVPVGGRQLDSAETLSSAGVLAGDVLVIGQVGTSRGGGPVIDSPRERVAELVDGRAQFWSDRWARRLAGWVAVVAGALLLIPTSSLPAGPSTTLLAATVAALLACVRVFCTRVAERCCAATALLIAGSWAAFAGAAGAAGWVGTSTQARPAMVLAAAASALLLSAGVAVADRTAIVQTTALAVATLGAAAAAIAAACRVPPEQAAISIAMLAIPLLGVVPRPAIVAVGLAGVANRADPADAADLEGRIAAADRLFTGALVGLCLLIVAGVMPAALSPDSGSRLLAAGVGLLLPLRARAFTQLPHTLAPRIGGIGVLAAAWVGCYSISGERQPIWIMAAAAGVAVVAAATIVSPVRSPVGRARSARLLGAAEHVLVVALVVLAAGELGLFGWAAAILG